MFAKLMNSSRCVCRRPCRAEIFSGRPGAAEVSPTVGRSKAACRSAKLLQSRRSSSLSVQRTPNSSNVFVSTWTSTCPTMPCLLRSACLEWTCSWSEETCLWVLGCARMRILSRKICRPSRWHVLNLLPCITSCCCFLLLLFLSLLFTHAASERAIAGSSRRRGGRDDARKTGRWRGAMSDRERARVCVEPASIH